MSYTELYDLLGVAQSAATREIKSAFRRLARTHHPDLNPGDEDASERFIEIVAAFEVLSDPARRSLYDEFGLESMREHFDPHEARARKEAKRATHQATRVSTNPSTKDDHFSRFHSFFDDILKAKNPFSKDFFDDVTDPFLPRGADVHTAITITLGTAARGGTTSFMFQGSALAVKIPAGAQDGDEVVVPGEGEPSKEPNGVRGDLRVTLRIEQREDIQRDGLDLTMRLPVTITEAILGAKIAVPTPHGACLMTLPEGVHSGAKLRLKEMGMHSGEERGDFYVVIEIRSPTHITDAIREAARIIEHGYRGPMRGDFDA
ncbi:MAG: DnaJ C-terminal domain-containing protein [Myxococcota bacterium]